jgi:hypothetical protein
MTSRKGQIKAQRDSKGEDVDVQFVQTVPIVTRSIKILHFSYAVAHVIIISFIFKYLWQPSVPVLLSLLIGALLVIDNLRRCDVFSEYFAIRVSKLCFFSHEVVLPFGFLYFPYITPDTAVTSEYWGMIIWSILVILSVVFAFLGLQRYSKMTGWAVVDQYGVPVYFPSHYSHEALIPIFMQVIGFLICSGYLCWTNRCSTNDPMFKLLATQLVVFLGNGVIGPNKLLRVLFANFFEILWLWSLVQATIL